MHLRPRPSPPPRAPADRVRDLLATGVRGWVPPPEPGLDGPLERAEPDLDADVLSRASAPTRLPDEALPGAAPVDAEVDRTRRPRARLDPGWRGAAALVVVALVAALVAGGVVLRSRPQEVAVPDVVGSGTALPGSSPSAAAAPPTDEVVVAVAGEVVRPGLVRLPAGSRVDDAVRAAGGPVPGADTGLLNLARKLVDGEQVLVGVDPPPGAAAAPAAGPAGGGLVDLNSATAADLDALPGIGPVLAQRIVDWRTEHGRFASVEQLREVTGIGESKYADLADGVTV